MTTSDIANIVLTVGIAQLICDLLANYFVYNGEPYKRAVGALERARSKMEKAKAVAAKNSKHEKRLQRAKDDYGEASGMVAKKHTGPSIMTSIFFVILLRILATEHSGKIIGLIPFVPFKFLQALTARNLDFGNVSADVLSEQTSVDPKQGVALIFIYMLSALSVKFYVNKLVAQQAPPGADRGMMTVMYSPAGQRMLRSFGIDPDEFKEED